MSASSPVLVLFELGAILFILRNVYVSAHRWRAVGMAVVGFIVPGALGFGLLFVLGPAWMDVIGTTVTVSTLLGASFGASLGPERGDTAP